MRRLRSDRALALALLLSTVAASGKTANAEGTYSEGGWATLHRSGANRRDAGAVPSVGKLPQGSEQPIQMRERGLRFFLAQVAPAHGRVEAHAHLAGAAGGALVAAAPRARIGVRAFSEVEHEAVGGVLQLLRQLAPLRVSGSPSIVALDAVDQRHEGALGGEGEVESVEAHR